MYILYAGDFTRAVLVQWVLEEGKLEYELRNIDILQGQHRSAEYLAINPAGLVPVLITPEGDTLYEVAALMVYLADRHQLTELAPAVADPCRGRFLSTVFHIASDIQPEMKRFHFPHRFSLRLEDNAGIQALAKSLVISRLGIVNNRLAQGRAVRFRDAVLARRFLFMLLGRVTRPRRCLRAASGHRQALRSGSRPPNRHPIPRWGGRDGESLC